MVAGIVAAMIIGIALGTLAFLGRQVVSAPKRKQIARMSMLILDIEERADAYSDTIEHPLATEVKGLIRTWRKDNTK